MYVPIKEKRHMISLKKQLRVISRTESTQATQNTHLKATNQPFLVEDSHYISRYCASKSFSNYNSILQFLYHKKITNITSKM